MTTPHPAMTAVVLAGGRATRFGGDKLTATVGTARVLDGALAAASQVAERVLLAGPGRLAPAVEPLADARGDAGPLGGIVAALAVARTPLLAVVAGDLPHADATVLRRLASAWRGEVAVVGRVDGVAQPLHAVWAVGHAARVRDAFEAGARSPTRVCVALGARHVDLPPGRWAVDVDTPADLAAARRD